MTAVTSFLPLYKSVHLISRNMSYNKNIDNIIREIFLKGVQAVTPQSLFKNSNYINSFTFEGRQKLSFCNKNKNNKLEVDITNVTENDNVTNKNFHVIGFGKAVLGMAIEIERLLGNNLKSGIISIPFGQKSSLLNIIKIKNGAYNNLPDKDSVNTSKLIKEKVESLNSNDILIVLISGGGSCLLSLPISAITLDEKLSVINKLVKKGATINELNLVRCEMSELKGGKLALLGKNAHQIISLIISDVIGDPLNVIASGPTYLQKTVSNLNGRNVLEKFNILSEIPKSVYDIIINTNEKIIPPLEMYEKCKYFIIGNNKLAIESAMNEANKHGYNPITLSNIVQGNVNELSLAFYNLTLAIKQLMLNEIKVIEFKSKIHELKSIFHYTDDLSNLIIDKLQTGKGICLISGGEPTVNIIGNGIGGRNQELALRFSLISSEKEILHNILFLSAGTDGFDGPNPAAGAIGNPQTIWNFIQKSKENKILIEETIKNNDSYNFYKTFCNGSQHIITGHTGTNVMDLHIIIIPNENVHSTSKL